MRKNLTGKCRSCGACCKIKLSIPLCIIDKSFLELEEYCKARGYRIEDNKLVLDIENHCPHLTEDNKCDIYSKRPKICKEYPFNLIRRDLPETCGYKE